MVRLTTCSAVVLLLLLGVVAAQDDVDVTPGLQQSRKMPRGRRARAEVRTPAGDRLPPKADDPARVKTLSSGSGVLPENTPFPPRGFAKGIVTVIGDDSGPKGTYRLAFKYLGSGQVLPFVECKMFQSFEERLAEHGPAARRGGLVV